MNAIAIATVSVAREETNMSYLTPADFPHTRNVDSDLRYIVDMYFKLAPLPDAWAAYQKLMNQQYADFIKQVNDDFIEFTDHVTSEINQLNMDWAAFKTYVENYLKNLDVQDEINNKLDELVADGTISELLAGVVGNTNPIFVDSVSEMTDRNSVYVLNGTGHIYQWNGTEFSDTGLVYGIPPAVMMYRGLLTGTTLYENKQVGFYNIRPTDNNTFTDVPLSGAIGGNLFNISPTSTGGVMQIVVYISSKRIFMRFENAAWTDITQYAQDKPTIFRYNGIVSGQTLESNNLIGFYNIRPSDNNNFTDVPVPGEYGGNLINFVPTSTGGVLQFVVYTGSKRTFIRFQSGTWTELTGYLIDKQNVLKYNGLLTGSTLYVNNLNGYYNIRPNDNTSFTDVPMPGAIGGNLLNISPTSTGGMLQFVFYTASGKSFYRFQNNPWTDISVSNYVKYQNSNNITWYALGDSITQGYYSEYNEEGTPELLFNPLYSYAYLINSQFKNFKNFKNIAIGGSGFVHLGTHTQVNACDIVDNNSFADAQLITLMYGINDWHYDMPIGSVDSTDRDGTIYGNISYVIKTLNKKAPNAKIVFITPLNCYAYGGDVDSKFAINHSLPNATTLQAVVDAIKYYCNKYCLEYVEATNNNSVVNVLNMTLGIMPDGIHPSRICHEQIAHDLATKINYI